MSTISSDLIVVYDSLQSKGSVVIDKAESVIKNTRSLQELAAL